jgi:hypothetical protein
MNHLFPSSTKRTLLGVMVILTIVCAGLLVWRHLQTPVPAAEVAAFLDRKLGAGRYRLSAVQIGILRKDEADLQLSVAATARLLQPLYSKLDATDFLQRKFQLNAGSTADVRRMLADKSASQNPELAGAGPLPTDPYQAAILQLQCPAGASFDFRGVIDAHRDAAGWSLALSSGGLEGGGPRGEVRSSFGDSSFVAGDASEEDRLRSLAVGMQVFAGRVAEARKNSDSIRVTEVETRKKAFLALVVPGGVFSGQVFEGSGQLGTALYLEIAGVSPDNEVTAFLRNEGSWHNARMFRGSWSADNKFETPVLNLLSRPDQAVGRAGPFLENAQIWSLVLRVDAQGGLSERNQHYQYQFQPLKPEHVASLKARLEAEFKGAMAGTESGLLYRGTVSSKTTGTSEPMLLRFTGRSEGGESIEAVLESTIQSWKRTLRGAIVGNSRRSGGEPIRLRTGQEEATVDAPAGSVFADREDLDIRLGIKGGVLIGEDDQFTYRFAIATQADSHQLEVERAERVRCFNGIFRVGIVYDGLLHGIQSFTALARLEIVGVERQTGAITVRMRSLDRFDVYRDFRGIRNPSGGSIVLDAMNKGKLDGIGSNTPFFKATAATTLYVELIGSSIVGRIHGDPRWWMEFSAETFLSATTESSDPKSPSADGSVFPAFPKSSGAYLLSRGSWMPLPRNGGHVVTETIHASSEPRLPASLFSAVEDGVGELAKVAGKGRGDRKVSYLEFDGKDPRPESNGPAVVLLFVGPMSSDTPAVEMAPAERLPDGRRRVEIRGGLSARIRFGEQRLAAYVRQVAPGATMLTTTSAISAGPYVFNAGAGYELTQR